MIGPSLISLSQQMEGDLTDVGLLLLLLPVGFLIGLYICRFFLSHNLIHWLIVAATILHGLTLMGIIISSSFFSLIVLFMVLALGKGILNVACNVMLIRLYKENTAPYMNALHFLFGVGMILSPLLVGLDIQYFNEIRHAYIFFALLCIPALIMLLFVRIKPIASQTKQRAKSAKGLQLLFFLHIFFFLYLLVEASYGIWIYPYMKVEVGLDAAAAGFFTSCFWLAFTLFRLMGIFLSMYFHPMKIMLTHSVVCLSAIALILMARDQLALLWLGNIALGGSLAVFAPYMIAYVGAKSTIPLKDISHFFASLTAGIMVGPWLLAQIFVLNPSWTFYPLLVAAALLLFILLYLNRLMPQGQE